MKEGKISFKADINNNFKILHLDPSLNLGKNALRNLSIDYSNYMIIAGHMLVRKKLHLKSVLKNKVDQRTLLKN